MKDTTTAPAFPRACHEGERLFDEGHNAPNTFEQYEARRHTGPCHGHPSDSYRHDAENDGLPLTTGGQYDEIGWLLARGLLIVAGVAIGVALYKVAF